MFIMPMSAIGFGAHYGVSGYTIENAIWLDGGADYLSATPLSPSSARIGSLSFWTKPAVDSSSGSDEQVIMQQDWTASGNEAIQVSLQNDYLIFRLETNAGAYLINRATSALYRDPSAWYHFHITWNTNTTSASCVTITVNGVAVTAFSASSNPGSAADSGFPNTGKTLTIGKHSVTAAYEYHNGYLAEFIFQDNVTSAATDFGEYDSNNVWIPKNPTGTVFGDAGFWLNFANTGTGTDSDGIGADVSGNNKHFAVTSMAAANVVTDTPTDKAADGIGNYCTWNAVAPENQAALTYSNANLTVNCVNSSGAMGTICTTGAGKWYFEITMTVDNTFGTVGFIGAALNIQTGGLDGNEAAEWCWQDSSGVTRNNSSAGPTLSTFTANDVLGWAVDFDNDLIWCHKNGTWQNSATLGEVVAGTSTNAVWSGTLAAATGGITPSAGCNGGTNSTFTLNCGQSAFNTAIPTGFKTIHTANLRAPAIPAPREHHQVALVTHDGSSTAFTCNWNADTYDTLFIIKSRGSEKWYWLDGVRGYNKYLSSDATSGETTDSNVLSVSGATITLGSTLSSANYVVECHKAGLSASRDTANAGSIGDTGFACSANTTSQFSITTYIGNDVDDATVQHGLTSTPQFGIVKRRDTTGTGVVIVNGTGGGIASGAGIQLSEADNAVALGAGVFSWTSDYVTLEDGSSNGNNVNINTGTYISYQWSGVSGYSQFGLYEGSGVADGPMIYGSMLPSSIYVKNIDATGDHQNFYEVLDDNVHSSRLAWNGDYAEATSSSNQIDILSTGFKQRCTHANNNAANTYMYAMWAESPIGGSGVAQAKAR